MHVRGYELTYPRILLAGLVIVCLAVMIVGLSTSSAAFGAYNPTWDGTQSLRGVADTSATLDVAQSTQVYTTSSPPHTTAVIISPNTPYSPHATQRIHAFVRNGGTLLIAGDVNHTANELLAGIGATTRINTAPVRDPEHHYQTPALPIATNVSATALTTNVSRVTLNYPTSLDPGPTATVHVATSGYAYRDTNQNQALDSTEAPASRPIIATEPVGEGRVIVVSDPSIFINAMLTTPDNHQLATNILTASKTVVFDYSHTTDIPLFRQLITATAASPWLQLLAALLILALTIGLWAPDSLPERLTAPARPPANAPPLSLTHDELVAGIARRHPAWDDQRIERVARRISQDTSKKDKDD